MHVLEAVIFAILMLASVAFVVTYEVPTTQHESFLTYLDDIAQSSLDAWAGTPPQDPHSPFPTRLEQWVAEALMGDDSNLTEYLDLVVPLGSTYRLTLETGNGTIHVAGEMQPPPFTYPRTVASREMRLRPSGTFLQSEFGVQDGLHPLRPTAVTIDNGRIRDPGGIPLEVRVTYTNGTAPRTHATVHYTAQDSGAPVASASLTFADEDDQPIGSVALAADGAWQGRLVLTETGDAAPVPAGTLLTIRVPTGWSDVACDDESNTAWTDCVLALPSEHAGGSITATLLEAVRNRDVPFHVQATYADQGPTRLPFSPWRAELSGPNGAAAELLVAPANNHLTQPASPMVGVTMPNPLGDAGPSQFLVTVGNGRVAEIYVQRIEIEALDDSNLFATVDGDGWSATGRMLVWTGDERVLPRAGHDFGAEVRANRVNATGSYAQETVRLEFDDEFRVAPPPFGGTRA